MSITLSEENYFSNATLVIPSFWYVSHHKYHECSMKIHISLIKQVESYITTTRRLFKLSYLLKSRLRLAYIDIVQPSMEPYNSITSLTLSVNYIGKIRNHFPISESNEIHCTTL